MRPQLGSRRSDRAIERVARGQHGVITLAQLERLGLSARGVRHRTAAGRLRRLHRSVYALHPPSQKGRWTAAVLACGEGALLSHRSAAALWGLLPRDGPATEVVIEGGTSRTRPKIVVHRLDSLPEEDRAVREGIPCTALPRTLLDLAAAARAQELARAVERAEELRVFDLHEVEELLARSRRRRGLRALQAALADHRELALTRSEAEERLLVIVVDAGLPTPEVNTWIPLPEGGGYRPDFLWRDLRLIVEVDGRAHHARRRAFEHDRRRDRRLALAGFETRRFSAAEVLRSPKPVAAELRALLGAAAATGRCSELPPRPPSMTRRPWRPAGRG